jgi:hypothetical protein
MFGNWRCFQRCVLKVPRLFQEFVSKCENWRYFKICVSKVPTLFHEFVLKCLEIECVSKECMKGGTKLLKACGN